MNNTILDQVTYVNGFRHKKYSDGSREVVFPNGDTRRTFLDGSYTATTDGVTINMKKVQNAIVGFEMDYESLIRFGASNITKSNPGFLAMSNEEQDEIIHLGIVGLGLDSGTGVQFKDGIEGVRRDIITLLTKQH